MHIKLSPQNRPDSLTVEKSGDILTINGEAFDFTDVPEGGRISRHDLPNSPVEYFQGDVTREDGVIHLTLLLPHGDNPEPWQIFPEPVIVTSDGVVDLPHDTHTEVEERAVEGGTERTTTVYRWRQEPEVMTTFIHSPSQESEDVEA